MSLVTLPLGLEGEGRDAIAVALALMEGQIVADEIGGRDAQVAGQGNRHGPGGTAGADGRLRGVEPVIDEIPRPPPGHASPNGATLKGCTQGAAKITVRTWARHRR
jgi:hypothetical protein